MRHRRWLVIGLLALAACSGDGGAASRPTVTPADASVAPTPRGVTEALPTVAPGPPPSATAPAPTAQPAAPAGDPAVAVVFGQPLDGSVQAIGADGQRRILVDPTTPNQRVAWQPAPDGRAIAAVIFKGVQTKTGGYDSATLWTVGVDATAPRKLLDLGSIGDGGLPNMNGEAALYSGLRRESWTADGRWIILPSSHEGQIDLYAVAADGGEIRRLTDTPEFEFDVVVAPDGGSVAYASTTSFGTGGGLGDPRAWLQPLFGEPQQLTEADPAAYPMGASVIGWLDDLTPLAYMQYQPDGRGEIWTIRDGVARLFQKTTLGAAWDLKAGRLALTAPVSSDPGALGPLLTWASVDAEPVTISDVAFAAHLAPQPDRLLICGAGEGQSGRRVVWLAGAEIALSAGTCDDLAWSESGYLALGPSAGHLGSIIGLRGETRDATLPLGAKLAGWHGETLYFFAPTAGDEWQLYLIDVTGAAVALPLGAPFAGEPSAPALVIAR